MTPMEDDELDRALRQWQAPPPPAQLERRALDRYRSEFPRPRRWRSLLAIHVRVPLPAAVAVVVAVLGLSAALVRLEMRAVANGPSEPAAAQEAPRQPWGGLQPVSELRPRVIRSGDEAR